MSPAFRLIALHSSEAPPLSVQPGKQLTFGRKPTCDVVETAIVISGCHCVVKLTDSGVEVTDQSSNGTFVNEQLVGKGATRVLTNGDILDLAKPREEDGRKIPIVRYRIEFEEARSPKKAGPAPVVGLPIQTPQIHHTPHHSNPATPAPSAHPPQADPSSDLRAALSSALLENRLAAQRLEISERRTKEAELARLKVEEELRSARAVAEAANVAVAELTLRLSHAETSSVGEILALRSEKNSMCLEISALQGGLAEREAELQLFKTRDADGTRLREEVVLGIQALLGKWQTAETRQLPQTSAAVSSSVFSLATPAFGMRSSSISTSAAEDSEKFPVIAGTLPDEDTWVSKKARLEEVNREGEASDDPMDYDRGQETAAHHMTHQVTLVDEDHIELSQMSAPPASCMPNIFGSQVPPESQEPLDLGSLLNIGG